MRCATQAPLIANTKHGMPIDGDLSRLLVSSMIALPGSPSDD
jgi:hypothetical protein